jgi:hypothetical protein
MSCIARTVAECKKKWQDVQGTTKKKEAARRAIARATGRGPPPVCNLNLIFADTVCIYFLIISRQFVRFFFKPYLFVIHLK